MKHVFEQADEHVTNIIQMVDLYWPDSALWFQVGKQDVFK